MPVLHPPQHLEPVHLGHHHVEQNEVRRLRLERGEALFGATGFADDVAVHLEVDADELAQLLVVVDDEDERSLGGLRRPSARAGEKRVEVRAAEAAVASGGVEGRQASAVRPFADRALGDAEIGGSLAKRQPFSAPTTRIPPTPAGSTFSGHVKAWAIYTKPLVAPDVKGSKP